jgi:hypothetical protein
MDINIASTFILSRREDFACDYRFERADKLSFVEQRWEVP